MSTLANPPNLKPYTVRDSGLTIDEVFDIVNEQVYLSYSSGCAGQEPGRPVAGCLFEFDRLLTEMTQLAHLEFVSHHTLLSEPCPADRIRVGIRHDVDSDVVSALKQAEVEHKHGVVANWVILHTAWYYGYFEEGIFRRHNAMAHVYRRLQDLGHEVSLHTDALMVYQDQLVDGAAALKTELEWMRSIGLDIRGSTAHNHRPAYGAENYEMFRGYVDNEARRTEGPMPEDVVHNGRWAPLRILDPEQLGLEYEGNEVFWQNHTPLEYGAIRLVNQWNWHAHRNRLRRNAKLLELPFIDQERMLDEITRIPLGTYLVLVVHPCYYGNRDKPTNSPLMRLNQVQTHHNTELGWFTHDPMFAQCWSGDPEREQCFQVISQPNNLGMLDFPADRSPPADNELSIMFLGADNLDGLPVAVDLQAHARLHDLIERHTDHKTRVTKLAFSGMGVSRLWAWYERTKAYCKSDVVVVGIGDQSMRHNIPFIWSRESGCSLKYPAGDYLHLEAETGNVEIRQSSANWRLHARDPHKLTVLPPTQITIDTMMAHEQAATVNGFDCDELLLAYYKHLISTIRADGARPVLLIESNGEAPGLFAVHGGDPGALAAHQAAVLRRIERLAENLDTMLVNPYPKFEDQPDALQAHAPTDPRWNTTGHRLVAEALFEAFVEHGII